jgi:hypothetical protein
VDRAADARRRARAAWTTQVFRTGEEDLAADADAAFWDEIPMDQRAGVVWELSREAFSLSLEKADTDVERGSSDALERLSRVRKSRRNPSDKPLGAAVAGKTIKPRKPMRKG